MGHVGGFRQRADYLGRPVQEGTAESDESDPEQDGCHWCCHDDPGPVSVRDGVSERRGARGPEHGEPGLRDDDSARKEEDAYRREEGET